MESYVSSEEGNRKKSSLNTVLKSLNDMITRQTWKEEKQNYTTIYYRGDIAGLSNPTILNPRSTRFSIPVIATIGDSSVIVGYFNNSFTYDSSFEKDLVKTETFTETYVYSEESSTQPPEDHVTYEKKEQSLEGLKVKYSGTIVSKRTGEWVNDDGVWKCTAEKTTTLFLDYSKKDCTILMRF